MASVEKDFPGPLDNPDLSQAENRRLDRLMDAGGHTSGEAWRRIPVKSEETVPTEVPDAEVAAAAHRVVGTVESDDSDIPTASPPRPGESDESIRSRHRQALRERDDSFPPDFDPKVTEQYLERGRRGDFSDPDSQE